MLPESFPKVTSESLQLGQQRADELTRILVFVSFGLTTISLFNGLDFLFATLLGCAVVGLNYHWTARFVLNLLEEQKVRPLYLAIYATKFVVSMIVLYLALNDFGADPVGLLIGLSNILLAVLIYAGTRRTRPSDSPDVLP
jgi:hypothetical protein